MGYYQNPTTPQIVKADVAPVQGTNPRFFMNGVEVDPSRVSSQLLDEYSLECVYDNPAAWAETTQVAYDAYLAILLAAAAIGNGNNGISNGP